MPIVHVRGLSRSSSDAERALIDIATAVASAAGCEVNQVWTTFQGLDAMTLGTSPAQDDGQILYVDLLMQPRGDEIHAATLTALAQAAAVAFEVDPNDVWARLTLVAPGTVYAGGGLI